jgi:KipI family sensor histidine kinase inhibitor
VADRPIAVEPVGDSAVLVRLGDEPDPALTARAAAIADVVESMRPGTRGLGRPVPAHASVLVPFDPLAIAFDDAIAAARSAARAAGRGERDPGTRPPVEIAVAYDGPDLAEVAERHGLRADEVAELPASATYRVLFLGFAPGFAYLGGLPAALETPRRATPRERVPHGSVAIAGRHTAVYPLAMPGGWNLIGRTDAVLFDPSADPPALLRPGALVRFVPATGRR